MIIGTAIFGFMIGVILLIGIVRSIHERKEKKGIRQRAQEAYDDAMEQC